MRKRIQTYLKFSIPVLVAGILVSCGNSMSEIRDFTFDASQPIEISEEVTIQITDEGTKKYVLESPTIEKYLTIHQERESEEYRFPDGFTLHTYDSLGILVNTVSAKNGSLNQETGEVILRDSVHMINVRQEELKTDLLYVYFEKDSIFTDVPVTVSSLAGNITGKNGLTSNLNFTYYRLNEIEGAFKTNELYDEQTSGPQESN